MFPLGSSNSLAPKVGGAYIPPVPECEKKFTAADTRLRELEPRLEASPAGAEFVARIRSL